MADATRMYAASGCGRDLYMTVLGLPGERRAHCCLPYTDKQPRLDQPAPKPLRNDAAEARTDMAGAPYQPSGSGRDLFVCSAKHLPLTYSKPDTCWKVEPVCYREDHLTRSGQEEAKYRMLKKQQPLTSEAWRRLRSPVHPAYKADHVDHPPCATFLRASAEGSFLGTFLQADRPRKPAPAKKPKAIALQSKPLVPAGVSPLKVPAAFFAPSASGSGGEPPPSVRATMSISKSGSRLRAAYGESQR
jgi:hypothetical protein